MTLNLYFDIQNLYNYKTEGGEFLYQQLLNGQAVIENPGDPLPQQRYALNRETTQAGTLLPSVGIIIKF